MSSTDRNPDRAGRLALSALLCAAVAGCASYRPMGESPTPGGLGVSVRHNAAVMTGDLTSREQLLRMAADFRRSAPNQVRFDFASARIDDEAERDLQAQAAWLIRNPGVVVVLEGHADEPGTPEANQSLGLRRARAVADRLSTFGVNPNQLLALESRGAREPVVPVPDKERRNRRVETIVAGFGAPFGGRGFDGKRALLGYIEYVGDASEGAQAQGTN
jgi:outer membrane protein OmpA-like peptidoglycan-associated protein